MQIFVKNLDEITYTLDVSPEDTIESILDELESRNAGITEYHRISFHGKLLDEESLVNDYNIQNFSTLNVILGLDGGAKKRKKKSYTTPKKNKHKKKKVKLAVLRYYQVDENGKITRLREECRSKKCGAGVFMAAHHDRLYCGRCHTTRVFEKPGEKI